MGVGDVVRVRFRAGVVGEAERVVHYAVVLPMNSCFALCDVVIEAADAELINELGGMPCMACVRAMALRPTVTEPGATGVEAS